MKIQHINTEKLNVLRHDTKPLSIKPNGKIGVLRKGDNEYIKFFYPRKGFSSDKIVPFYKRFINNTEKLHQKNISTCMVKQVYYSPDQKCHIVVYQGVKGEALSSLLSQKKVLLDHFIVELVRLHEAGIFFRDLHFDNILQQPSGEFALVDIADCSIFKNPLSINRRARSVARLLRIKKDVGFHQTYGTENFIAAYCRAAGLSPFSILRLRVALRINQILRKCRRTVLSNLKKTIALLKA